MISLTLTSYGSTLSGLVNIDGFVLSSKLTSVYENISSLSDNYLDCDSCGNIYNNSFRLVVDDTSSNSYTAYSIVLYTIVSSVKKAVAYYSSDQPIVIKESSDHIHKFIQFFNIGGSITSILLQSISSSSRSSDNNTDGMVHIEDESTSLDDNYSVYSKSQVDSLLSSSIPTNVSSFTNDAGYITAASLPTVNNSTITIKVNSDASGDTFTTNASSNKTINLGLSAAAVSGSYSDLSDKPTIPTVNNATLTIKKNSSDTGTTFTANASSDVIVNLGLHAVATSGSYTDLSNKPTIPTSTSDLTNNSGFITSSDIPTNVSSFTNDAGYLTSYTETDPTVPSWAKASSKPSYDLDEVADGSTRKLSNYVPTTRKINGTALSSDVTLSLDDVSDGSTRKLSNYVLTSTKVNSKALSSNITLSLDDIADGSSRKLSNYELKSNLKEGAYVDVDETTMTSSSTNLPTGKAVASYVTSLGYITSSSLPTVNNSTITIKKNSDDTGDSFTTNASSAKTINLGLATVATSGSYSDLSNKPTIPTVNNATLTIKKNATDSGSTFTANASSDVTVNLGLATVATSGSYNDLTDKPSGGDYLSLIGKSVTIGATGEVGVVYQPASTYEFPHYEHTTNYSSLNSALVSNGWTLTNTWKTVDSYIDNGVIYYTGSTSGGTESKYYKSHQVTNNYTMDQIEQGIIDFTGSTTKTFASNYDNSLTLIYGDTGYNSSGSYNQRTFVYSGGKFTVSASGTAQVPEWKYKAINESSGTIDEYSWIFSAGLGLTWYSDPYMTGGSTYSFPYQWSTAYINNYTFSIYDQTNGYWHRTTMWNSQTNLPYGGTETGYFITIQEDVYVASSGGYEYPNGNWSYWGQNSMMEDIYYNSDNDYSYQYYNTMSMMYGSDPESCWNSWGAGGGDSSASFSHTDYHYIFCDPATFGAFISGGANLSFTDDDSGSV